MYSTFSQVCQLAKYPEVDATSSSNLSSIYTMVSITRFLDYLLKRIMYSECVSQKEKMPFVVHRN